MDNPTAPPLDGKTAVEKPLTNLEKLTELHRQIGAAIEQDTPLALALRERDQWSRMWYEIMNNVLKVQEEIRDELHGLNRRLDRAYRAGEQESKDLLDQVKKACTDGAADTAELRQEIRGAEERLLQAIREKPAKRKGIF